MKGADAKAPSVDADLDGRDRPRLRPPPGGDSVVTPTPSQWSSSGGGGTPASGAVVPESTAPRFAAGTSLSGRYRIVRFIAAGGMGEVYEAEDLALGAEVALKTMRPELAARPTTIARFRREILLARRVTHPNVCRIFDLGQHLSSESGPEVAFLTMELLSGQTLGQRLRSHGPMSVDEALPLVAQMAAALGAAHDAGVVHRDFKAANVMLVPARSANAPPRVVVTDFGIASAAGGNLASITRSKDILGTPAYVAPEQVEGREVTAAADIYALGVVLYEVVTGRLPFEGASVLSAVLKRFRDKPAAPRHHAPDLPARWDEVILRCLERDPRNRFRSTDEVVKALRGEAPPRARETTGRGRMLAACLTAAALTAAGPYLWTRRAAPVAAPERRASARRAVAVLGFKNLSGNPHHVWLSTAFSEMLAAELNAGSRLRTIPGETVARMKADLVLSDAESLGADTLSRIHSHVGADTVVVGSYLVLGEGESAPLRLDLRLQDATRGETIASITETGTEARMFELVAEAGRRLRERLEAGPLSSAEAGALRSSLPTSAEAVRLYAEGLARLRSFDALAARSLLEQAIQADPRYAPAHAALAEAWAALGYDAKAAEAARRAHESGANLPREERLAIEGRLREVNHEWPKAVEIYRSLWTFFPDDLEHGLRFARAEISAGQATDARETLAALRKLKAPDSEDPRIELTEALASEALGDFKAENAQAARAVASASARGASQVLARARLAESLARRYLGNPREAVEAAAAARQIYETVGDRGGVALSLLASSRGHQDQGDLAGARQAAEEGLAIRRDLGDRHGTAHMLNRLAGVLEDQGEMALARRTREESLALFHEVGNPYGVAVATLNLGNLSYKTGDHEDAIRRHEAALVAFRDIGNQMGVAAAHTGLGNDMKARGDLQAARRHFDEALATNRETGDVAGQSRSGTNLGMVAVLLAELDEAQRQYEAALNLAEGGGNKSLVAISLAGVAEVQRARGDLTGARRHAQEALAIRSAMGEDRTAAETRLFLAEIALREGRAREADAQVRPLPDVFRRAGAPEQAAQARAIRALALLAAGEIARAETEVHMARSPVGRVVPPETLFTVAVVEGRVRTATGDAAGAAKALEAVATQARKVGLKAYELEARLAQGEAEMRSGRKETGRARLSEVEAEARGKGLALLARQAAAAGESGPSSNRLAAPPKRAIQAP